MTTHQDFPFVHRLKVRWVEVDPQQVVFNGHYLMYFDTAMSEYWRAIGHPYPEGFNFFGGEVLVRRNMIEYHAPARLDDWLDIGIRCERIGNTSITMAWSVWTQGRLLATGESVYVYTALATGRPAEVPQGLRQQIECHAHQHDPYEVVCGPWSQLKDAAASVRRKVFVQEQGIAEAEEWDADDEAAVHAIVRSRAGLTLGTARLILQGEAAEDAKLGRMAVIKSCRAVGLGRRLLHALMDQARQRGVKRILISAQVSALPFYKQAGFVAVGEPYDEVSIPHQAMVKAL